MGSNNVITFRNIKENIFLTSQDTFMLSPFRFAGSLGTFHSVKMEDDELGLGPAPKRVGGFMLG